MIGMTNRSGNQGKRTRNLRKAASGPPIWAARGEGKCSSCYGNVNVVFVDHSSCSKSGHHNGSILCTGLAGRGELGRRWFRPGAELEFDFLTFAPPRPKWSLTRDAGPGPPGYAGRCGAEPGPEAQAASDSETPQEGRNRVCTGPGAARASSSYAGRCGAEPEPGPEPQ